MSTYSGTNISLEDLELLDGRRKYYKVRGTDFISLEDLELLDGRRKYYKVRGTDLNLGSVAATVTTYYYRVVTTGVRGSTTSIVSIPANSVVEGITTS